MTSQIIYTQTNGGTPFNFTSNDAKVTFVFPEKTVVHQDNKVGVACDPNRGYRIITCTAKVTGALAETLNDLMLPASAPDYTGAYPTLTLYWTGTATEVIEVASMECSLTWAADNAWWASMKWEEKTK